jgi:PTH2 family peptidyl-tRNA hydrolase
MDYKQVIIVRADLKMSVGKTSVQVAHASLSSAEYVMESHKDWYEAWKEEGQKKVVGKVPGAKELFEFYERAKRAGLPCYIVNDAGLTELEPGTTTTLGIGPAPNEIIDKITGELRLLG